MTVCVPLLTECRPELSVDELKVAVHVSRHRVEDTATEWVGRTDVCVLPSLRVTEPRRGLFLPYESLPFRRCRLPLVVSAVSDPIRHPFDVVAGAAIVPLPW